MSFMYNKDAIIDGLKPVFSNWSSNSVQSFYGGLFRLKNDLKFKVCLVKVISTKQFRIHGLNDTLFIPP